MKSALLFNQFTEWMVSKFKIEELAEAIAKGHSQKHLSRSKQKWADLGVTTEQQFKDHIAATLTDEQTLGYQGDKGRQVFYNRRTNTFVAADPGRSDKGSCYRPDSKEEYFLKQHNEEGKRQQQYIKIEQGGHKALNSEQADQTTQPPSIAERLKALRDREKAEKETKVKAVNEKALDGETPLERRIREARENLRRDRDDPELGH
jgi:hypothetical protein